MQIVKIIIAIFILVATPFKAIGQAVEKDTIKQEMHLQAKNVKKKNKSFVQRMLEIFGITATTSMQKNEEIVNSGQIWICSSDGSNHSQITKNTEFRSPIILPDNKNIIALRNESVIKINLNDGSMTDILSVQRAIKIIGYEKNNVNVIYLLCKNGLRNPYIVQLNLETIKEDTVHYDVSNANDRLVLNSIKGEERYYGDIRLFTQSVTDFINMEERKCIFMQTKRGTAKNMTQGMEGNFEQPSLSQDGKIIVYIKIKTI